MEDLFMVKVPATTANLGCGFDTLSIGLQIYMMTKVSLETVNGSDDSPSDSLSFRYRIKNHNDKPYNLNFDITDRPSKNLVIEVINNLLEVECEGGADKVIKRGEKRLVLEIWNNVPIGRGMGSSAAAIVTGLIIGNEIGQLGLSRQQIFERSVALEPSADNLSAAIFGNFNIVCAQQQQLSCMVPTPTVFCQTIPISKETPLKAVLVVPHFQVLTNEARTVVPLEYSRADTIFNLQRIAMVSYQLSVILQNQSAAKEILERPTQRLLEMFEDRLHQPYRQKLIPGFNEMLYMEPIDGMFALCISGSGSTILCLSFKNHEQIAKSISDIFGAHKIQSNILIVDFDDQGATLVKL